MQCCNRLGFQAVQRLAYVCNVSANGSAKTAICVMFQPMAVQRRAYV